MTIKICTVGYNIPGFSNDEISFASKGSLMDADILVFCPQTPGYTSESYQGQSSYDERDSFKYKEHIQHWKKEMLSFAQSGKTIFIFLVDKEKFYLKTGTKDYKPKVIISHVDIHDNYEFLPLDIGDITTAHGELICFSGNTIFNTFYNTFKKDLEYRVYLENAKAESVVFTGKDKTKILGATFKVGAGHLVVLPYLVSERTGFVKYKKNKKGEEKAYWTTSAIKFGNILVDCLIDIAKGLSVDGSKTLPPAWIQQDEFASKNEIRIQSDLDANISKRRSLEQEAEKLQSMLHAELKLKALLYEQSVPLEDAVTEALKTLGFQAENFKNGILELDQVITSPEGYRYVGECEGKDSKAIDITKFRQLLESLNADFAREEITEKAFGILFGNAERLTEPNKRTLDFTQKCIIGANREKIALVKTIDLFNVVKYVRDSGDENFKKQCRNAIHNGLGTIVIFPVIPERQSGTE